MAANAQNTHAFVADLRLANDLRAETRRTSAA
jgi:hypothetical protein